MKTYWLIPFLAATLMAAASEEPDARQIEFFEKHIRPILVNHCYKCHSAQAGQRKGDLQLDSRQALLKGGGRGLVIVPGDPENSLLVRAVRFTDPDLRMPPEKDGGKLSESQIHALESWVAMGAPDPRTEKVQRSTIEQHMDRSKQHWAFQPVRKPAVPQVQTPDSGVQNSIDAFVLSRLQESGLQLSSRADKRTLIRRATFDLTGLPPTPEEVDAFIVDTDLQAYENLIDRLLASPDYGERWGRHWLDVARYADTHGAIFSGDDSLPYAWTYRDWVIRALNDDLPYDQFLVQQLAADQLQPGVGHPSLAALGFLTVGRKRNRNVDDECLDDRIDLVGRGLMGLTVACARCHDHKLEPVTTRDYYSLYGIFKTSVEPKPWPLIHKKEPDPDYQFYKTKKERLQAKRSDSLTKLVNQRKTEFRAAVGDYLIAANDAVNAKMTEAQIEDMAKQRKINHHIIKRWKEALNSDVAQKEYSAILTPWLEFAAISDVDWERQAGVLAAGFASNASKPNKLNLRVASLFVEPPTDLKDLASRYGKLFAQVDRQWRELIQADDLEGDPSQQPESLPDSEDEALRAVLYGENSPLDENESTFLSAQLELLSDAERNRLTDLEQKVKKLEKHPGAPARAMALQDDANRFQAKVFVRGNPKSTGPATPPKFLEVLAGPDREEFTKTTSGRLELAQAIASPDNPLTSRVFVNRIWAWHFGTGLVDTPSDFGFQGQPPVHPELLDWLASRFMADGWSIKKLHRLIMLSATYQQRSFLDPTVAAIDPEVRLLWRFPGRPLEFEALRDSFLAVSRSLDRTIGGHPAKLTESQPVPRRTVYGLVDRRFLPGLFRNFDFPDPNFTASSRSRTAVSPQALYLLNSPFMIDAARRLAAHVHSITGSNSKADSPESFVRALYQAAFQREPSGDEILLACNFIQSDPGQDFLVPEMAAWQYGYMIVGETDARVGKFMPMSEFREPSGVWVTPALGPLKLTADGGEIGSSIQHATVRRWIAPRDGFVRITSMLTHNLFRRGEFANNTSDGIRGRILSSRSGQLGQWDVNHSSVRTVVDRLEVKEGDAVDFVVEGKRNSEGDQFGWAPVITSLDRAKVAADSLPTTWDASLHFGDMENLPASLDPWEKPAQVLLISNEFAFLD